MDQHHYMCRRSIQHEICDAEFEDVNEQYRVHPSKWASTVTIVDNKVTAITKGVDMRGWVIFSDASASSYGTGWGYAAFKNGLCKTTSNGALTKCTIFTAEAYALYKAVQYVNNIDGLGRKEVVEIRSDAQGLVKSLGKTIQTNKLLGKIKEELCKAFHSGKNVVIRWIPGHCDIKGNDYADSLAKKGNDSRAVTPIAIMRKDVARIIRERESVVRSRTWNEFESRNIKFFLPDMNSVNKFVRSSPTVALCQLVSGHSMLNDFVCKKLGLIRSAFCSCKSGMETVSHFLFECPLYDELRADISEDFEPNYDYITKDWEKLQMFVTKTGRFEKSLKESLEGSDEV